MKIEKIKLSEIVEYENNAKNHPKSQLEQIKKSIEMFGYNDPIALDENNMIIEGHGRYLVLKELAYDEIECIKLEHMTPEEIKAYRLVHNKINLNTSFDVEKLNKDMEYLKEQDFDIELTGFTDIEFNDGNDDYDTLDIEEYEDEDVYNSKYICPNCNYVGDKKEFNEVYE